jgi:hypothetical protein
MVVRVLRVVRTIQEISPPFSTGVEKVVEMTRSWWRNREKSPARKTPTVI